MANLKLSYYDTTSGKFLLYERFAPFHEGYFEGVCIPMPGDLLVDDNDDRYIVVRREFMMKNETETSKKSYIKTIIILEKEENLETL